MHEVKTSISDEMPCAFAEPHLEESLINSLTVRKGMQHLSTRQRELILLIDVAGFSYKDVAKLLQIPVGTVMSRIARARSRLRQNISTENLHSLDNIRPAAIRKTEI